MVDEPYVAIEDVAKHFAVSVSTVRSWIRKNTIPHLKLGGVYRFRLSSVEDALSAGSADVEEAVDDRQMVINFDPAQDL